MISWSCIFDFNNLWCHWSITLWYNIQYHVILVLISYMIWFMISQCCIHNIKNLWYHRSMISEYVSQNFQVWYHTWFQGPSKTRLAERCRSRAWPHRPQQVQSRRRWAGVLLVKEWPVLVVRRIQTGDVLRCQPKLQRGAWWDNLLAWCCMQGCLSWCWTGSLREITTQLGSLHAGRSIPAHTQFNHSVRLDRWSSSCRVKRENINPSKMTGVLFQWYLIKSLVCYKIMI